MPKPRNSSWNAFWDLATEITDEGWFGEIRIPFSTLRFEIPDSSLRGSTHAVWLDERRFVEATGKRGVITSLDQITAAVAGDAGTVVVPN